MAAQCARPIKARIIRRCSDHDQLCLRSRRTSLGRRTDMSPSAAKHSTAAPTLSATFPNWIECRFGPRLQRGCCDGTGSRTGPLRVDRGRTPINRGGVLERQVRGRPRRVRSVSPRSACLFIQRSARTGPLRVDRGRTPINRGGVLERQVRGRPRRVNQCLRGQLAALSQEPITPAPRPSRPPAPSVAPIQPRATPSKELIALQPTPAWPNWADGVSEVRLRPSAHNNLEPAEVFKKVAPSVYVVLASVSPGQRLSGDGVSQGSAIAVSQQDLITNCHVVEGKVFVVIIQKGLVHEAKLVKSSPASDRCVIRVESVDLSPIQGIRNFSDLAVVKECTASARRAGSNERWARELFLASVRLRASN